MTRSKDVVTEMLDQIQPDRIYRTNLSPQIFGYGPERTRDLIAAGELPAPFPLTPSSKYSAWTGKQILEHRARVQKIGEAKVEAARAATKQSPPDKLRKIKKLKLKKPAKRGR